MAGVTALVATETMAPAAFVALGSSSSVSVSATAFVTGTVVSACVFKAFEFTQYEIS